MQRKENITGKLKCVLKVKIYVLKRCIRGFSSNSWIVNNENQFPHLTEKNKAQNIQM